MDLSNLKSQNLERLVLGGLIKHPDVLIECDDFIGQKDFTVFTHETIFLVLRRIVLNAEQVDKVILAERIRQLGITKNNEIDIFSYVESISCTQINKKGLKESIGELVKLRICREICDNASEVQKFVVENKDKGIRDILIGSDTIYNRKVKEYESDEEPIDMYEKIEPFILEIAKNPTTEAGLMTPFPEWNRLFGGLRLRQAAVNIISRGGEGKSVFLFNMVKGVCQINKVKGLIIDTEMDLDLNMFRAGAAESGVNAWLLETGNWVKNEEVSRKVSGSFRKMDALKGSIFHKYAPNKTIHETLSIIRKWVYKYVGKGNPFVVAYDYLKITSNTDKYRQEHQILGDYLTYLNELIHDLGGILLTAAQQSRGGESQGIRFDDSTTVAASDRINQYASFNAVFRRKTLEEQTDHGLSFGSHLLKPFKYSRVQGRDSYHQNNLVRIVNPRDNSVTYRQNFLNYQIEEYALVEKGTYADVIKLQSFNANIQSSPPNNQKDKKDDKKDDGSIDL